MESLQLHASATSIKNVAGTDARRTYNEALLLSTGVKWKFTVTLICN